MAESVWFVHFGDEDSFTVQLAVGTNVTGAVFEGEITWPGYGLPDTVMSLTTANGRIDVSLIASLQVVARLQEVDTVLLPLGRLSRCSIWMTRSGVKTTVLDVPVEVWDEVAPAEMVAANMGFQVALDGKANRAGDTFTGNVSVSKASPTYTLNTGAADEQGLLRLTRNNLLRWVAGKHLNAESTGNAGSDYIISRYSDAGSVLGTSISVRRSDGRVTFETDPFVGASEVITTADKGVANGVATLDADTYVPLSQINRPAIHNHIAVWTAAELAANIAEASTSGRPISIKAGTYVLDTHLNITQANVRLEGSGLPVLMRSATSASNFVARVSGADFRCESVVFDGNKAANTLGCNAVQVADSPRASFYGCEFRNAKVNAGWGDGLSINGLNGGDTTRYDVLECIAQNNDGVGIAAIDIINAIIQGNRAIANSGNGISLNNLDLTFTQKMKYVILSKNEAIGNLANGIQVGNFLQNNTDLHGYDNFEADHILIEGNIARTNSLYGIAAMGDYLNVLGNLADGNCTAVAWGGFMFAVRNGICSGNISSNNGARGFECGGAYKSIFFGNISRNNQTADVNAGGCRHFTITDNLFENNANAGVVIDRYDGASEAAAFDWESSDVEVSRNRFILTGAVIGVHAQNGVKRFSAIGNSFEGGTQLNFMRLTADDPRVEGNYRVGVNAPGNVAAASTIYVSDYEAGNEIYLSGASTTINLFDFFSASSVGEQGVAWCDITAPGSGYTSQPTVVFTGGGGTGAAATALITADGRLVGIRITSHGSGYTSAPTVSFTGGGGTGAAATAIVALNLGNGRILNIHCVNQQTFSANAGAVGAPPVDGIPLGTNVVVPAGGSIKLRAFSGRWKVASLYSG